MAAIPLMRRLVQIYKAPCDFVTTPYCAAMLDLLVEEPGLVNEVHVYDDYKPTDTQPGMQPFTLPIPPALLKGGHRDIFNLGFRRFPLPHEDLTACMGTAYGLENWGGGPWLRLAKVDKKGPIIMHAPVENATHHPVIRELLTKVTGRQVLLVGTCAEYPIYQKLRLDELPGVTLKPVDNLLQVWELCEGASGFLGVASSPAMVCAGAGLPSKWVLQAGGRTWCIPRKCDVSVIGTVR